MSGIEFDDIRISLQVAGLATLLCVVVGLPLSWALARYRFRGRDLVTALVTLPLVLPPTVVGYYLLRGLGRGSAFGRFLEDEIGWRVVFTWQGAAIGAAVLSAPLLIRTAQAAFEGVDRELERVAATLGRSRVEVFFSVTLPLAMRGVAAGIALAFARAIGEFGATIMIAGNIPGKTRTMPVSIYDAVQAGDMARANATALLLIAISLLSLLAFSSATRLLGR